MSEEIKRIYVIYGDNPNNHIWECSPPIIAFNSKHVAEQHLNRLNINGHADYGSGEFFIIEIDLVGSDPPPARKER